MTSQGQDSQTEVAHSYTKINFSLLFIITKTSYNQSFLQFSMHTFVSHANCQCFPF